jgi:gamma-glutamyl:cysteine ligase YbdK (ATP-grasp superfamily)
MKPNYTVKIVPNYAKLSCMLSYAQALDKLVSEIYDVYDTNDTDYRDVVQSIVNRVNVNARMLGLPDIEIEYNFIDDVVEQNRKQQDNERN